MNLKAKSMIELVANFFVLLVGAGTCLLLVVDIFVGNAD